LICLINQANYLLHRQLQALEKKFLEEGGFTERLYNQRRFRRDKFKTTSVARANRQERTRAGMGTENRRATTWKTEESSGAICRSSSKAAPAACLGVNDPQDTPCRSIL